MILCLSIVPHTSKNAGIIQYVESGIFFWDSSYSEKAGIAGSDKHMRERQLVKSIEVMKKILLVELAIITNIMYYKVTDLLQMVCLV